MADVTTAKSGRRYRGQTIEQLRADRRERLLTAGERLIGRDGYTNTTIERICGEARVSTRHFYEHFDSREALLATLFDRFIEDSMDVVVQTLSQHLDEDVLDATLEALGSFSRFCMDNPERARIALVETVGVSAAMEQRRREAIGHFADLVAQIAHQLAEAGVLPMGNFRLSGIALVGAAHELLIEWLSGGTGLSSEQMERQITGIFRAIIKGSQLTMGKARE